MKTKTILGAVLMCIAMCLATGVEKEPVLAVWCLFAMGGAYCAFRAADVAQKSQNSQKH